MGTDKVRAALASVERRFAQHNARVARATGVRPGQSAAAAGAAVSKMEQQVARRQLAAQKRASLAEMREQERVVKNREKLEQNYARRQLARQKRQALAEMRLHARAAEQSRREFRKRVGGAVSGTAARVGAVGRGALAVAGIGGGALVASKVAEATRLDEQVRRLSVAARAPGQEGVSPDALKQQVRTTAVESGIAPEQLTEGLAMFVQRTGDLTTAVKSMKVFATVAQATGASMSDVASTAADLSEKFDIKTVDGMSAAFAELAFMGKKGAFEIADMAQQFPELAAAAQRVGMKGVSGMKQLGGLAQIARKTTPSGAEASTALQSMLTQLVAKGGEIESGEAFGFKGKAKVFTDKGRTQMRDIPTVLADVIAASGGNLTQLSKLLDIRGVKAASPMISEFTRASTAAGGGKKGREAGREAVLKMIKDASESGASFADIQTDAGEVMKSTAVQLEILNAKLGESVEQKLVPALLRLLPQLEKLVPAFEKLLENLGKFLDWTGGDPWKGLGAVAGAALVLEIGKAGIAGLIQKAFMSATGGGAGNAAAAAGAIGAGRAVPGKAGLGVAAAGGIVGLAAATAAYVPSVLEEKRSELASEAELNRGTFIGSLQAKLANLLGSDEKPAAAPGTPGATVASVAAPGAASQKPDAAADKLLAAASELHAASNKLSSVSPNRTAQPSPVK